MILQTLGIKYALEIKHLSKCVAVQEYVYCQENLPLQEEAAKIE